MTRSLVPGDRRSGRGRRPFPVVDRQTMLLALAEDRTILHLGCTNAPYTQDSIAAGTNLHVALRSRCRELWGLDNDCVGLDALRALGDERLIEGDLEDLAASVGRHPGTADGFQLVIAGEIIEHLSNPGRFLDGLHAVVAPNGKVVLTTVNAYCGFRFAISALRGRGGTVEPVHPDHVAYYSRSTLSLLLKRHGLAIEQFGFYDLGDEHRQHTRRLVRWINAVCTRFAPQLSDGIYAVCSLPLATGPNATVQPG